MKWNCLVPLMIILVIKLIGTSLFLLYASQIFFQEVPVLTPSGVKDGCPIRWVLYAGKCYFFSAQEKTWDESQENCAQSNSHLAVVNNKAELMFLLNRTNHLEYFIGLTQQGSKGPWRWIDNTALNVKSRIYDCAVLGLHMVTSAPCSVVNRWICEEKA
ncbi:C-type lectin domain family 5 member A isoform X2 [Zootoca vivipara]|uniref:C-type lectin domain family 5 member A isoform X2 n=1 Tax=Zootoca vivipara TaxID=8524 RepID=UPI00293BBCBF|nr:C-type lectin domain family 5 member A isoform X2 [Zootoca vivipara]